MIPDRLVSDDGGGILVKVEQARELATLRRHLRLTRQRFVRLAFCPYS